MAVVCHLSLSLKGHDLAMELVATYLFPASKMILDSVEPAGIVSVNPRCTEVASRIAAYMLLIELCCGSHDNLVAVSNQLVTLHHHDNPQFAKEWEVSGTMYTYMYTLCSLLYMYMYIHTVCSTLYAHVQCNVYPFDPFF